MTTDTLEAVPVLTALNRCDRCGAQAYVRATLSGGSELLFCAHHGREHMSKLVLLTTDILDESKFLKTATP